jgi:uncharacterized protein (DUF2336 family)
LYKNASQNAWGLTVSAATSIISEVESALHDANGAKRMEVLRRVTDLFVGGAEQFSADQTALFDDVLSQLVNHIEGRAAVELSQRLAPIANAPAGTVRQLALHNDIDVSGPILEKSERLTDADLIEIAKTRSQAHLNKIAGRGRLNEGVTDVLVDHGDAGVANTLATNASARFSGIGMAKLVMRADGDDRLTESLGRRTDVSPDLYRQLLAQAADVVRNRLLESMTPDRQDTIKKVIAEITAQVTPKTDASRRYADAQRTMRVYSQDTEMTQRKILEFANKQHVAEVAVGLSILSGAPVEQVDRLLHAPNGFGLMVLCRSLAYEWQTAYEIIGASPAAMRITKTQIDEMRDQYAALTVPSAQRVLRFWQGRQKVAKHIFQANPS